MQGLTRVFAVLIAVVLSVAAAQAQTAADPADCSPPQLQTDVRPLPHDAPTQVNIGAHVIDVVGISDVDQTISIDMGLRLQWTDPRLTDYAGCRLSTEDVWFPYLILVNSGRMFQRWPNTVSIDTGGRVTYMQRQSGTFSSYHTLENFPFDTQNIQIVYTSLDWSREKLAFTLDEAFTGLSSTLNISDWRVLGVEAQIEDRHLPELDQTRSTFVLTVEAQRYVSYYVWKVILPICLIVVMSWAVFYIHPSQFGTQLGLSATSVLTMVAYIFATTNLLPKLGYLTPLDSFVAMATVFVFAGLVQSLITGFLATRDYEATAVRIDLISRFAFPIMFAIGCYYFSASVF